MLCRQEIGFQVCMCWRFSKIAVLRSVCLLLLMEKRVFTEGVDSSNNLGQVPNLTQVVIFTITFPTQPPDYKLPERHQ